MDFIPEEIARYAEAFTTAEPGILAELNRETWGKMMQPRMLSGHLQGRILAMLSRMIQPMNILEIGTFTGYSAICLCEGLKPNGRLTTIDVNEEYKAIIRKYVKKAGLEDKIELIIGNATEIIPGLSQNFDMVFIDADKENYSRYFDLVFGKVRQGGFIVADNVLWSGKVLSNDADAETMAIKKFNEKIKNRRDVEHILIPVRDGLMVTRKL